MKKRFHGVTVKHLLGIGLSLAVLAVAGQSFAGASAPRAAKCVFNADGSGTCSGTLTAFRKSADPTAQLILQNYQSSTGMSRYVALTFGGTFKVVPLAGGLSADMLRAFDQACTAVDANVFVHWNTSSQVDTIQLYNDSGLIP